MRLISTGFLALLLLTGANLRAALLLEIGDAGRDLATAQPTTGLGLLDTILGELSDPDPFNSARDVDLYLIRIVDPSGFRAFTVNAPGVNVSDPQLFLFDSAGRGVYMNDDDESGLNGAQSELPPGHPLGPSGPGLYYLGIGWWNNEPFSASGLIFSTLSALGTNGPDLGAGGADPLAGWNDDVLLRADVETLYEIRLVGAGFAVPEPGTFLPVLLSGIVALAMRRRRRL